VGDLGPPIAYTALEQGTPVRDARGEPAGIVEHVLADDDADIFDGIIVDQTGLGGRHRFADAEQIEEIHERAVVLSVSREELHAPDENPAVMEAQPDDTVEGDLERRLCRAAISAAGWLIRQGHR
jgi:uncharacterized protein YrrD